MSMAIFMGMGMGMEKILWWYGIFGWTWRFFFGHGKFFGMTWNFLLDMEKFFRHGIFCNDMEHFIGHGEIFF